MSSHSLIFTKDCIERDLYTEEPTIEIPLDKFITMCPKLTKLEANLYDSSLSDAIYDAPILNNLTELQIEVSFIKATIIQIEAFFKKCPNLISLEMFNFEYNPFDLSCLGDHIKNLNFCSFSLENFKSLLEAKNYELNFFGINVSNIYNDQQYEEFVILIEQNYPNLKHLELSVWELPGVVMRLPKLKYLEKLELHFSEKDILIGPIKEMLEVMTCLKYISLVFFTSPSKDQLLKLCQQYCPNIEIIFSNTISFNDWVTSEGLKVWKKLKKLKKVNDKTFGEWQVFDPKENSNENFDDNFDENLDD